MGAGLAFMGAGLAFGFKNVTEFVSELLFF